MNIDLRHGLPYISAEIEYRGQQVKIENVLLDTGSAGCMFDADQLSAIGLHYEPFDLVHMWQLYDNASASPALIAEGGNP